MRRILAHRESNRKRTEEVFLIKATPVQPKLDICLQVLQFRCSDRLTIVAFKFVSAGTDGMKRNERAYKNTAFVTRGVNDALGEGST
jgi:hypothetical protein